MTANINSMFYAGEKPWHSFGVKVDGELNSAEAIRKAGLNWTVSLTPVNYDAAVGNARTDPRHYVSRRDDTNDALGVVGDRYHVLQNQDAFSFFDAIVGSKEAMYHTAGALGLGERIWMLAKLPGDIVVKGADTVERFLLLTNSHDGNTSVTVKITPIRVVCQNTLSAALNDGGQSAKLRHTRFVGQKVKAVREMLGLVHALYDQLSEKFNHLADRPCGERVFEKYVEKLGLAPKDDTKGTEGKKFLILDDLLERFNKGKGNDAEGIRYTWWSAYNAVVEYVDYSPYFSRSRGQDARTKSILFGVGNQLKEKAMSYALSLSR